MNCFKGVFENINTMIYFLLGLISCKILARILQVLNHLAKFLQDLNPLITRDAKRHIIGTITSAILLLTIPYMSCRSYSCSPDVVEKMDGNPPIIIFIGCSQLILATCLIGWIWSIVWGGWIVQLACTLKS